MKQSRKIYDLKEKAVQLSYERHNISELARELGITALSCISGVKSTKSLEEVFQVMAS
jgi:transposase-like protein